MNKISWQRFSGLSLLAALLSVIFIFLGAPLVRVLRNVSGSWKFWVTGLSMSLTLVLLGLFPIASIVLSIWLLIGIYAEAEERGWAGLTAGLVASFFGTVTLLGLPQWLGQLYGVDMAADLKTQLKEVVGKMQTPTAETSWASLMNFDFEMLWGQIPSIIFILMMTCLALALMFDRRTANMFNLKFEKIASQIRLFDFRLPDWMIWATMLSFLLSFLNLNQPQVQLIAMNLFNIFLGLWFFQGLAVLEVLFIAFRVGSILRLLVYFLIVGQMFFLLSALGIIDYWVDFRKRVKVMIAPEKDSNNEGHI